MLTYVIMHLCQLDISVISNPLSAGGAYARINPFRPEFTIVIFINYKPRIAVAILDL